MPIFVHLMRRSALTAAFALGLASCGATPVFAQAGGCTSRESIVQQATEAAQGGAVFHHFKNEQAAAAMTVLLAAMEPPPRPINVTEVVMLVGPYAAVIALVEGEQACFILPVPLQFARGLLGAAVGTPA